MVLIWYWIQTHVSREPVEIATKEVVAMENYFKVSSMTRTNPESDTDSQPSYRKNVLSVEHDEFGKVFKNACDELKQNQAAHTISRVLTLN